MPQESIFSSLRQSFNQDFDHEVVRGHFDVGAPSSTHRYYCLVDPKTGKREPNGVPGKLQARPDGMTGIKANAVSTYSCASAEQQGILVTTGYTLSAGLMGAAAAATPPVTAPAPAAGSPSASAAIPAPRAGESPIPVDASTSRDTSPGRVEVAGLRLGMSPDEVRTVLKSKRLRDYYESSDTLNRGSGRFVNVIEAWAVEGEEGESFAVMFTPVPGKERVMGIVHSMGYASPNAPRETELNKALVNKYGGFAGVNDVPAAATWRIQSGGNTLVGDACDRRTILGGLAVLTPPVGERKNLALKTSLDEFRFQIEHCGISIVTADHALVSGDNARSEHLIARFTVTAYSPSIGFDGAVAAAQMLGAGGNSGNKSDAQPKAPALSL